MEEFSINVLPFDQLPYLKSNTVLAGQKKYTFDKDSIPLYMDKGQGHYHPVLIAQYALPLLHTYIKTRDTSYLNYVVRLADKLISTSVNYEHALFFPYTFNFALHGCAEEMMIPPWYSGMAQGQVLSLFCRLYETTHERKYKVISRKIFKSFTLLKGQSHSPWVSCVDKNGNLWLEEYPRDLPNFTLNGKVFAIYGVYDYYRITKKKKALKILCGAITTIKDNIHKFRNVNDISWYCLKHQKMPNVKSSDYHKIHVSQLYMLYDITGDEYFREMARNFEDDALKKQ
jgi:hypothetical protein